uniref:FPG_CAT domain-containing protein n=1 Tax=Steinernema glaseri TaxID=37863 RepID=A0A1I7YIA0_9BILA
MHTLEQAYAEAGPDKRVVDTENRTFNTNHAVVGYYTAKSWRLPEHVSAAIANHHNALAVFSDDSARNTQLKNLLAILKMAEHICSSYRVLGNQSVDHEWNTVGHLVLDYVGLSEYDFENLKQTIREMGQRVSRVVVRERRLRWPIPEDLDVRLSGQRFVSVERRAKYLLLNAE